MQSDSRLSNGQVNMYGMLGLTQFMTMMPAFMYYRTFLQVNLAVPAAILSVLVLVGTGVDFALSLVAGPVVEKTHGGNKGKYRWWFYVVPPIMFIGSIVTFLNTTSIENVWVRGLICIAGYILICASVTFMGNANFGIMAAMAGPSLTDRNRLSAKAAQMMALATIFTSLGILPVINAISKAQGSVDPNTGAVIATPMGYMITSGIFGATIFIGAFCILKASKPYDLPQPPKTAGGGQAAGGVSVGQMFKSVATNSQLLMIMLIFVVYNFGFNFAAGFEMYYFMFWKSPETFGTVYVIHQLIRSIASYVAAIVGPKLGQKLGKKNALAVGLLIWGSGLTVAYFLCGGDTPWYVFSIVGAFNAMAMYIFQGFGVNYFLDCGEYGYYKTGVDNRTVSMAMFNVPIKVATMIAGTMSAMALGWIGFDSVSIGGGELTDIIKSGFMFWFALFPAICMFLAALLAKFGYKITDQDAQMYAVENAKKMAPAAAAPAEEA